MSEFKSQLVNGAIPIFSVCNHLDKCSDKTAFCPNGFNAREYPCAIAVSDVVEMVKFNFIHGW